MVNALDMLTSQLQQRFETFEKQLMVNRDQNGTTAQYVSLDKYIDLEQKYNTLKQENVLLKSSFNATQKILESMQNKSFILH